MARHRVPVQALRNFLSILFGFAVGAVNNLVILPWAFADDLETWGLVRIVTAWGFLFAPILIFGAPAAMNRYAGVMNRTNRVPQFMGSLMWPPIVLFAGFIALPALAFPEHMGNLLNLSQEQRRAIQPIAIISGIITARMFFTGFLTTKLKTSLATFVQETVFKFGYACLGVCLGLGWIGKIDFLPAFVGLHFIILLILFSQAIANQFRVDLRGIGRSEIRKEIRQYGGALVIGSGAWVILSQLDIIMVGSIMGLEYVPIFTVAAFIATVTNLPARAAQPLLTPLISQALDNRDDTEIDRIIGLSHRSLLLSCGWIVTCIWVSFPQIDPLLPEEFRNLSLVILTLGFMQIVQSSSKGSSILLSQSDHFQKTVIINWSMVAVAVPLNYLFISKSGLGLGLLGAAMATFISITMSTMAKQALLWRIWKRFIPNLKTLIICVVLLIPALSLTHWNPSWHPVLTLLVKSALVTGWIVFATIKFNLAPEGVQFAREKAPWLTKWL